MPSGVQINRRQPKREVSNVTILPSPLPETCGRCRNGVLVDGDLLVGSISKQVPVLGMFAVGRQNLAAR
jgi:hypothetical protein